ncbi:glutathione S-transferase family protein [Phenylobacterium immobile]|uniref:glutathione S-transferase family protein n=1 Tax=Phenylobacterium immobile TaxID=21 RepID=UPI000B30A439|nr:glutathione S-transferase N-terminal domain-containing protein [Phenylobacterium immobile]
MVQPIQVHYWPTPNGHKVTIALEEMGLPYEIVPVNIGRAQQFESGFLALSPNGRMPAIVDPEGPDGQPISVFESGAILQYLARKSGQFYGANAREQVEVEQWAYWQMAGHGPMSGQANHFRNYARQLFTDSRFFAYGANRYSNEVNRLYGVLEERLKDREYVAGPYSIADMLIWPWSQGMENVGSPEAEFPNVAAYKKRIAARPAVQRAMAAADPVRKAAAEGPQPTAEQRRMLFNQRARRS